VTLPEQSLSARQVRALAHPLRLAMLELLRAGPATASQLARELGESSGSTSYHLRALAKAGFVEDDPARGNARDRWWQRTTALFVVGSDPAGDIQYEAALGRLRSVLVERDEKAAALYFAHVADEPQQWQDASFLGAWRLHLTQAEARELSALVLNAVDRLRRTIDDRPAEARSVHVTYRILVQPDPPA
jgi:DNA-binding transcriptional ArsR family regulator